MLIDWFTVVAQIVNFLILMMLLKRFLFVPIVAHMEERQEKIVRQLEEAKARETEAAAQRAHYRELETRLAEERAARLRQAEEAADQRRRELLDVARAEVRDKRRAWIGALKREQDGFVHQMRKRCGTEIFRVSRRVLRDLADRELNDQVGEIFLKKLESLEPPEQQQLHRGAAEGGARLVSPFPLAEPLRNRIAERLRELLGLERAVDFQVDESRPLGIELHLGGIRLSWSAEDYLDGLETAAAALLEEIPTANGDPERDDGGAAAGNGEEQDGRLE
ncbi:MAG: hypothetical protein JXB25_04395 [Deltaproteobacteria bacterium]|nr:hypothetical protein [Deltaproteobacteria bacterium]